jgi:hypothetical protein
MDDELSIVLIPKLPGDVAVDPLFKTDKGIAVRASEEQIQTLRSRGIPVVTLYESGNEYAGAMFNLTEEQANTEINQLQDTRLAALEPDEKSKFGLA